MVFMVLVSLFCWHLLLLLFTKMNQPFGFILSIIIGILIGYIDFIDEYLSLSRTFVFFPFFLLGYYLKREHFYWLKSKVAISSATIIITSVFVLFYLFPLMDFEWLFGSKPYNHFETDMTFAWLQRLFIYGVSLITLFSFWAFVPRQHYFFTKLENTRCISIYYTVLLLNIFVVQIGKSGLLKIIPFGF